MGLDYVIKQLISIRGISKTLNIQVPLNGSVNLPENDKLLTIYNKLKDPLFISGLESFLSEYPYALYTILKLAELCTKPQKTGQKIINHADKVKRHLYRLYILRNAISHNAEFNHYIVFLNANLEQYLRGTINAMFYTSASTATVNSPESAFQCYLDMYKITVNELESTYDRDSNEHAAIKGKILKGEMIPKDNMLQEWISLHN